MSFVVPNEVGAVLTKAAEIGGAIGILEVSQRAYAWLKDRARVRDEVDQAKAALGLDRHGGTAYRHDSVHPLYSSSADLHPDNLVALTTAAGNEFYRASAVNKVSVADVVSSPLNNNLVLIGSPTAEGLSRPVFGYEPDVDGDSLALANPPIDLPLKWVLTKTQIDARATASRYVAGKGLVARPNWRIEGENQMFVPEVDSEGVLSTDYLLVTRLRNYLTPAGLDEGKYLVSFGGTHGTATRAIEILLRDRETLRGIAQELGGRHAAYQILIRVGSMHHDARHGTRATKVEIVKGPIILPDTQDVWRQAASAAKRNLDKWIAAI